MACDVFISHSTRDKPAADAICAALEAAGIRCWIAPRDVMPGRPYSGEIIRGIKSSRVMVLVFSAHSNTSPDVLREVQLATRHRLHLVNFRIEQAAVSDDLDYFLGIPHWLDALTPPMAEHHARLVESIRSLLALEPRPAVEDDVDDDPEADAPPSQEKSSSVLPAPRSADHHRPEPATPPPSAAPAKWRLILVMALAAMAIVLTVWQRNFGDKTASTDTPASNVTPAPGASSIPANVATPAPPADVPRSSSPPALPAHPDWPAHLAGASAAAPWVNSLDMKFVRLPMNDSGSGPFVLCSVYETRVRDFEAYGADHVEASVPNEFTSDTAWREVTYDRQKQGPTHPIVNVSWEDADAFCTWLTKREHRSGQLPADLCYRLPTDFEWSRAVGYTQPSKGPAKEMLYPWGPEWPPPRSNLGNYADATAKATLGMFQGSAVMEGNYSDGAAFTAPVGSYEPSALGLYDLGGNAWEWCDGWTDATHTYHTARGGSWMTCGKDECASDYRSMGPPGSRNIDRGFRVVIAAPAAK